jgi:hypothetical protein
MLKKILYLLPLIIIIAGCASNSSWMKDDSRYIDNKTIGELSVPGAHLANAYKIKGNESFCIGEMIESKNMSANALLRQNLINSGHYNQESFVKYLNTQKEDITEQLTDGVRYLELQVCKQNDIYYTSNIYLTDTLDNIITQIDSFVDSHVNEIVIIDLDNNLWAESGPMNIQDATLVYNHIIGIIGHNFIPKSMSYNTISQLKDARKLVVLMSSNPQLASFPFVWDKTQVALTAPAQYSTIQKISAIQNIFDQPENSHTLSIIPLYSVLPEYGIDNGISNTNNDDPIILNFLNQSIVNHAMIIVTDHQHLNSVIDLTIPNNQTVKNIQAK